jgi:hypothetical protein
MKRLALVLSVVAFVACKKAEQNPPAADTTAAPAAAPAPAMDSTKMMDSTKKMMDSTKMAHPRDTTKAMGRTKKPS